ncbi:MAG: hypothetical protein NTX21_03525, partial [Alphaproteobacteria bacterium]|nr:hypothetical protein [Alphaproteobacteria bacterium]
MITAARLFSPLRIVITGEGWVSQVNMKTLNKIEQLIYQTPAWKLVALVFAIMLFKTGIWVIPTIEQSITIASNPFANPFNADEEFLFWNWLGPFLAWTVGAKSAPAFIAFHFAFSVAFSALFLRIVFLRFSDQKARTSLILFCILPVSSTVYFWAGYDSITLFVMLLALATPGMSWSPFSQELPWECSILSKASS